MQRAAWCNKHKLKNDQGSNFYLLHLKKRKREEKRKKEIAVEGVIAFSLQLLFLHIFLLTAVKVFCTICEREKVRRCNLEHLLHSIL